METENRLTKEELHRLVKNLNRYKVTKPLTGYFNKYKNGALGESFNSDTLYERGYNINQLVKDGYLELIPKIFPFQKVIVAKNVHSVYSWCPDCQRFGINMPLDRECGNCGFPECITYYDAETIHNHLTRSPE